MKVDKETIKTIVIAVLVTGVITFIGGMTYQNHINTDKSQAVKSAIQSVSIPKAPASKTQ
jgi:Tfp pilus assembly protein PilE